VTTRAHFVLLIRQHRDLLILRTILDSEGYNTKEVGRCLGAPDSDVTPDEQRSLWQWRARHNDPLSVLIRLFFLGESVAAKQLRFVGEDILNAWQRQKWLGRVGTTCVAEVELSLQGAHIIACDRQDRPHRHFVAGPTRATLVLAGAMLPSVGDSVLDLGAGSGVLALRFSGKLRQRVATDISLRALRFAAILLTRTERTRRFHSWMSGLQAQGVQSVSTGVIVLRKRTAAQQFLVVDDLAAEKITGGFLARRLATLDRAINSVR